MITKVGFSVFKCSLAKIPTILFNLGRTFLLKDLVSERHVPETAQVERRSGTSAESQTGQTLEPCFHSKSGQLKQKTISVV